MSFRHPKITETSGRSLGRIVQHKKYGNTYQLKGAKAFADGVPRYPNPIGDPKKKGKGRAWDRGWDRARMKAQKIK